MISDLSIGDVAIKIAEYRDFKITHEDLVEWAREAMFATKIPPHQVEEVMDLLQDISVSTALSMRRALTEHEKLMSCVVTQDGQMQFVR